MSHMTLKEFARTASGFPTTPRLPVVFVGHGSPMNAIEDNAFTDAWERLGKSLPRPNAILCISAHWLTRGTYVEASERPQMIYDFYGFPDEMYSLKYDCPGAPEYAELAAETGKSAPVLLSTEWGIDHGTWVVLKRMYPKADVPVFQMSIDMTKSGEWHYQLARELRSLREKGVLIVSSGNVVHNLGILNFSDTAAPFEWAQEFDAIVERAVSTGDYRTLCDYEALGMSARLAVPTPDHYFPMLYTLGLAYDGERATFPVSGIIYGSLSMRCILVQ